MPNTVSGHENDQTIPGGTGLTLKLVPQRMVFLHYVKTVWSIIFFLLNLQAARASMENIEENKKAILLA